jgi:hypothetical protein
MPPTQYRPSRRNWVKLWTHEWLTGTVRWQLNGEQRGMWADLLALAGDSRFPGIVTPGEDAGKFIGYPVSYFAGLFRCSERTVIAAFKLFEQQKRIRFGKGREIYILNWEKYQSEYQEKRQRKQYKKDSAQTPKNVRQNSAPVESEAEGEVEVEGEVEGRRQRIAAAFATMNCEPYGPEEFQDVWLQEQSSPGAHSFVDAMERTAQRCEELKVKVPGRFFAHKREIEKLEAQQNYKRTQL